LAVLLVVEDDNDFRELISMVFRDAGHAVDETGDGETALGMIKGRKYDVVLSDVKLPQMSGLEVLRETKFISPNTEVLMMTGFGSMESAVEAMKMGAYDYLQKPFGITELEMRVEKAIDHRMLSNEVDYLRHERDIIYRFEDIIGESEVIKNVLRDAGKEADQDSPVLIYGEPGTGRQLIAGAIHYNSSRKDYGFVRINCAGVQDVYLESDLFGHVKGAFDEAQRQRTGRLEQANRGTVLLEEVSDLPSRLQESFLQFLKTDSINRLGGERAISVDIRVMASSSTDLAGEVRSGKFNEELYDLLTSSILQVPPLRSRKEDILLLSEYFIRRIPYDITKPKVKGVSDEALEKLAGYSWPGNIRELKNVLERGALVGENDLLDPSDIQLPGDETSGIPSSVLSGKVLKDLEKEAVLEALRKTDLIQKDAAKLLGISKRVIHYKIQQFGIKHPKWIRNK
jgi:DNA-binding NtrC family response regulator